MNFPKIITNAAENLAATKAVKLVTDDPARSCLVFGSVAMAGSAYAWYKAGKDISKEPKELTRKEKAKVYVKKLWIPVALTLTAEGLFLYSYKISKDEIDHLKKNLTATASAAAISSIAAKELKKAVDESLDSEKASEITEKANKRTKEKIKEENLETRFCKKSKIIYDDLPESFASHNWLIRDAFTGLWFEGNIGNIIGIINKLNMLLIDGYDNVEVVRFYEELGLPITPIMEGVGWSNLGGIPDQIEVDFEAVLSDNSIPYIEMRFTSRGEPKILV